MTQDRERSGLSGAVDRLQDLAGGAVGLASAATAGSHSTEAFVTNAAVGDLYEREAARLALARSRDEGIRTFARVMLDDHHSSTHQLQSTLRSFEDPPEVPTEPDQRRQGMLDNLREASDQDFDKRYLDQQALAHKETVTLFKGFAAHGDDPRLRLFAQGTLPVLERHVEALGALRTD